MCLAIPGKILEIKSVGGLIMAEVDFNGLVKSVCISWIENASAGDFILSHCGMGICRINKEEAAKDLDYLRFLDNESGKAHEIG